MAASSPINPYESPRETQPVAEQFTDRDTEVLELRQRLGELERRVNRSWFIRPNPAYGVAAVWGYFLLGYAVLAGIAIGIITIVRFLTGVWP